MAFSSRNDKSCVKTYPTVFKKFGFFLGENLFYRYMNRKTKKVMHIRFHRMIFYFVVTIFIK